MDARYGKKQQYGVHALRNFLFNHPFASMSNNLRDIKLLKQFGIYIRQLRKKKNMTMEDLAYACEVEYSQISRVERGVTNTTMTTLYALSKGLEIPLNELLKDFDTSRLK